MKIVPNVKNRHYIYNVYLKMAHFYDAIKGETIDRNHSSIKKSYTFDE